jgi:hypothetical protein
MGVIGAFWAVAGGRADALVAAPTGAVDFAAPTGPATTGPAVAALPGDVDVFTAPTGAGCTGA